MKLFKLALVAIPFVLFSCSKGGDTPATTPGPVTPPPVVITEADIAFKIEIDAKEVDYTNPIAALAATQKVNINVTSSLPKDGVTIDVVTKKNKDNTEVSKSSTSGTGAANEASITSLSPGVLCTVTVTVTSKTKSSNSSSKTFQIAQK